ncbi:hypothetical protein [Acinetobacter nosocomialis]|uniref:hypothetical protein n=1 Tax=Acinetobacter nosocomialis TaxID=106654 RepID=UPI001F29334F|nr:hypothetical protein [Acinetobacter nosocomialis]MCE7530809.1 hypothetical protein [Acinetobacter nosocomialis]
MLNINLPKTYKPYKDLTLCSNKMINNGLVITAHNKIILLIGKGETPQIWLNIPKDDGEIQLITASVPNHKNFRVLDGNGILTVYLQKEKILEMNYAKAEAEVIFLDFTIIGLNIKGNQDKLEVGKSEFSNNNIATKGSFISIDY